MIYLDVRTQEEYDEGHIKNALNLDVYDIMRGADPECARDEEIIVYCASGSRSGVAAQILRERGFLKTQNGGGYDGLITQGLVWERVRL